jgi:hypothetical protein
VDGRDEVVVEQQRPQHRRQQRGHEPAHERHHDDGHQEDQHVAGQVELAAHGHQPEGEQGREHDGQQIPHQLPPQREATADARQHAPAAHP